jgi:predicted acylesterase/phospholipase RssA
VTALQPDPVGEARRLERLRDFHGARAVVEAALEAAPGDPRLLQRLAVSTYKDPDIHIARRLDRAWSVLARMGDPAGSDDPETLGIAGAIEKRHWEHDGQERHLHRSLFLYRRGAKRAKASGKVEQETYTAINAAFILDVLADLERRNDPGSPVPGQRTDEARALREAIVSALEPVPRGYWPLVTLAEAFVGLGQDDAAAEQLRKARAVASSGGIPSWEIETTARQIGAIVRLEAKRDAEARQARAMRLLQELLGKGSAGAQSAYIGKVGLALSGGGFRASLFHIGVLARLAELDILRHVEVLSCVSGGSIVGTHYYLKVRQALEDPAAAAVDYVALVDELAEDFLAGVQQNLRMRTLLNPLRTLQIASSPTYSRTLRIGELYETHFYRGDKQARDPEQMELPGLYILPADEDPGQFRPKDDNWRRADKVPILVINATSLNTGHNWQYTASWMGEPPSAIDDDVDSADRLRRMYHPEAPENHRHTRLGHAVCASSCVPALFPPVVLRDLFPALAVRLVDGGVHDNQGVASLLDQDCSVVLVSDASGSKDTIAKPLPDPLSALSRTQSVLMSRVREAQFLDMAARRAASTLRGLMFIHLRRGLDRHPRTWIGGEHSRDEPEVTADPMTSYGIRKDVQKPLAELRTDLDAFSDLEALALMNSGYRMTRECVPVALAELPTTERSHSWRFLDVDPAMRGDADHDRLVKSLRAGSKLFFKYSRISPVARAVALMSCVALLAAMVYLALALPQDVHISSWLLLALLVGAALFAVAARQLPDLMIVVWVPLAIVAATVGWPLLALKLYVIDRLFLRAGGVTKTS